MTANNDNVKCEAGFPLFTELPRRRVFSETGRLKGKKGPAPPKERRSRKKA
jgi:hypothetical protein